MNTNLPPVLYIQYIPDGEFYLAELEPFDGATIYRKDTEMKITAKEIAYYEAVSGQPFEPEPNIQLAGGGVIISLLAGASVGALLLVITFIFSIM